MPNKQPAKCVTVDIVKAYIMYLHAGAVRILGTDPDSTSRPVNINIRKGYVSYFAIANSNTQGMGIMAQYPTIPHTNVFRRPRTAQSSFVRAASQPMP